MSHHQHLNHREPEDVQGQQYRSTTGVRIQHTVQNDLNNLLLSLLTQHTLTILCFTYPTFHIKSAKHIHLSKGMQNVQLIININVVAFSTLQNITAFYHYHFNYNYINMYYIDINLFFVLMSQIIGNSSKSILTALKTFLSHLLDLYKIKIKQYIQASKQIKLIKCPFIKLQLFSC